MSVLKKTQILHKFEIILHQDKDYTRSQLYKKVLGKDCPNDKCNSSTYRKNRSKISNVESGDKVFFKTDTNDRCDNSKKLDNSNKDNIDKKDNNDDYNKNNEFIYSNML